MKAVTALVLALMALMFVAGAAATESAVVAEVAEDVADEVAIADEAEEEDEAVDQAEDEEESESEEESEDEEESDEEADEESEEEEGADSEEEEEVSFSEEAAESAITTSGPLSKLWIESLGSIKCEKFDIPAYAKSIKKYWKSNGKDDKDKDADAWEKRVVARAKGALAKSGKATSPLAAKPATKFVLHTTGGSETKGANFVNHGLVTLTRKGYWPHFQIGREYSKDMTKPIRCVQFFPLDVTSFALAWGGHDSIQIEISATQKQVFTDDTGLAATIKTLFGELRKVFPGMANKAPFDFKYKGKGGKSGALPIVSKDAWNKASGLVGHMHAPGSTHGDPNTIDVSKLL